MKKTGITILAAGQGSRFGPKSNLFHLWEKSYGDIFMIK